MMTDPTLFELDALDVSSSPKRRPKRRRSGLDEAREFGAWSLNKLEVLEKYLRVYRRVAGNGTYIDGFAGTGHVTIGGQSRSGSAIIALESDAFRRLHYFELPRRAASLRKTLESQRRAGRCDIRSGDFNQLLPELLESGVVPRERPCFAFLDPNSTQHAWTSVDRLARYKTVDVGAKQCKVEMWILFNLQQAIQRLWPRDRVRYSLPPHAETLDSIMGDREVWMDLWKGGKSPEWLLHRYRERIEDFGYAYVIPQYIADPASGRPQYVMIHATDHDAAESFMSWAKRQSSYAAEAVAFPGFE